MQPWVKEFPAKLESGVGTWRTGITTAKFRLLCDNGDMCRLFRLRNVEEVLANPMLIHRGWSRPGTEECYIYIGKPAVDYRSESIETPPPQGCSFVVFVLASGEVEWWGWREDSESTLPLGI